MNQDRRIRSRKLARATVLLVGDRGRQIKRLADLLTAEGYAVVIAPAEAGAVKQVEAARPHLVIVSAPPADCRELCRNIRQNSTTASVPILAISLRSASRERSATIETGADDCLSAPVRRAELVARLHSLLRVRELSDAVQDHAARLAERERDLAEALERQRITGEILKVISRLSVDVQPVLETIVEHATRLCGAERGSIWRRNGDVYRLAVAHNAPPDFADFMARNPIRPGRGTVVGRVALEQRPVHIPDALADADYRWPDAQALGRFRTILGVPILREGTPVGVLAIWRNEVRPFSDKQIELVKSFADKAVIAIENVRLLQELQARNRDLSEALEQQSALGEVLRVINQSTFDLERVLETLIHKATKLSGAEHGVIYRFDGEVCRLAAGYGISTELWELVQRNPIRPGRGTVAGRVALERRTIHVPDALADPDYQWAEAQKAGGYRSLLGVPMMREGTLIGVLIVWTPDVKPFTDKQIELVARFADQAVIAIENVRLFEELQERTRALQASLEDVRALGDISRAVSSSLDLRQVLASIMGHAVALSDSDACAVFEFNPARRAFVGVWSHNLRSEFLDAIQAMQVDPRRSATVQAVERGVPVQIPDVAHAQDYPFRDITLREGFRALLAVPMGGENVTRGLVLFRRAPVSFDERVVNLVTALANQSTVAIENARLFEEVRQQRIQLENLSKNLQQLYRLSTAIQEPLSLKEQLTRVLETARQVVAIDRFYIWAVTPDQDKLVNLASAGFSEEEMAQLEGTEIPLVEAGAMYQAYRERVSLVFNEQNPLPPELRLKPPYSELKGIRTRSFLVVPMIARGRTVGVLTADNKISREPILTETVEMLQTFAAHAAVAVENARLFRELEEKSRQLEVTSRHKSRFLANMSHELRTPLNAIIGYTELILDNIYGDVSAEIREVIERLEKSGRHLLGLINDVLDLSKIEAGQLRLSVVDYSLSDIVRTVVTAVEPLAAEKKLALQVALPPDLPLGRGDERRLRQVLLNLVGNAIKFTEAGEVRIEAAMAEGAFLVSVTDTGPGIAPEDQETIFEEFQQGDRSSTRPKGGTGLGLAIVKRILELHGGQIWVESAPGQGATFRFTVPVYVEPPGDAR